MRHRKDLALRAASVDMLVGAYNRLANAFDSPAVIERKNGPQRSAMRRRMEALVAELDARGYELVNAY